MNSRRCWGNLDCRSPKKSSRKPYPGQSSSGQIVVEYVLLLVVAVSIAALITRTMIAQRDTETGFVISLWQKVITQIGSDHADDIEPPKQ